GNSPYQSFSTFAGNPLLISPERLEEKGLLTRDDLKVEPDRNPYQVDYEKVYHFKLGLLKKAYGAFRNYAAASDRNAFEAFCQQESWWLDDYALYAAAKDAHG